MNAHYVGYSLKLNHFPFTLSLYYYYYYFLLQMGKGGGENLFQNAKAYIKNANNILHMRNQNPATNVTSFFYIIWIEKRINHAL